MDAFNPYLWAKESIVGSLSAVCVHIDELLPQESGTAFTPNLVATALLEANGNLSTDDENELVWAACGVLGGGLDTASIISMKRDIYKLIWKPERLDCYDFRPRYGSIP